MSFTLKHSVRKEYNMDRQKLTEIILACKETSDSEGISCYLPNELPEKMCQSLLKKCAPDVAREDVLAIFATFVLTENALHGRGLESPLPLDGSWRAVPIYEGEELTSALIIFQDGTLCESTSLSHILPLLNRLSAAFGQEEAPVRPKVDPAKLHSLYGPEIRRQLEQAVNDSSGEWDRLYLRDSFSDDKIQKAIRLCRADIQPADVIAMEDVNLLTVKIVYLLTEYGLYAAYNKKPQAPILFDGLKEIRCGTKYVLYFLYEDGHGASAIPREAPVEKFLRRVLSVYDHVREDYLRRESAGGGSDDGVSPDTVFSPAADSLATGRQGAARNCHITGSTDKGTSDSAAQDAVWSEYEERIARWEAAVREEGADALAARFIDGSSDSLADYIDTCLSAAALLNQMDGASHNVQAARLYQKALELSELIVLKEKSEKTYLRLMVSLQKAMEANPRVYKAFQTDVSSRSVEVAGILYEMTGNPDYKDEMKALKKWNLVKKTGKKIMDLTGL